MTPDRIDALLARALETGAIPPEATAEERAQLEPMLANSREMRLNASTIRTEADASIPTARARFQRHLEAQRTPIPAATAGSSRPGFFARFASGRTMTFASSAAALGVIALLAILVLEPFSSVETASALTVDDYVQVDGVVSAAGSVTVTVQSPELGNLEVALTDVTAVSDSAGERSFDSLKPGDPVLISGVVTAKKSIAASNVAVAENQAAPTPVNPPKIPLLKNFRQGVEGTIRVVTLSGDGLRSRVLIVMPSSSVLVDVDPRSVEQFLATNPRAIGARVRVVDAPDLPKGVFRLQPLDERPQPTPGASTSGPHFENVRGVVVGRNGLTLQVQTTRGIVPVVVRPATVIRVGDSVLTREDIGTRDSAIGYEIAVSGNPEGPSSRRVIATLIIVIGKAPARSTP